MPPRRTTPAAKAIKTERTHEENRERAYIAASRRSDRSLEARVESARRASEIHKRRKGRPLRVTEQGVINNEIYEEEYDDLPHHYRRLTANLPTHSSDFNQRLSPYLTSHAAMRSALDPALRDSYATQAAQQAGHAQNAYSNPASLMNAHMSYQAQLLGDGQQPPYIIQNMMPPMPNPMPHPHTYLQLQQLQNFDDPQPRLTHSLQRQSQHQHRSQSASAARGLRSVLKSLSPVIAKPSGGMSMPVKIKSRPPAFQSIEQRRTPISLPSLTPGPQHRKRFEVPDFDSSESARCGELLYDKAYLPQCDMQAASGEFNPFATEQDDSLYDSKIDFSNDPLKSMFMAGSDALNASSSFDSTCKAHNPGRRREGWV